MNRFLVSAAAAAFVLSIAAVGCGPKEEKLSNKADDVKAFQGDMKSPDLKNALQSHFSGNSTPPPAPNSGQ